LIKIQKLKISVDLKRELYKICTNSNKAPNINNNIFYFNLHL